MLYHYQEQRQYQQHLDVLYQSPDAVSAVVESLDRITITFNKSVSRDTFMLDNKSDKVANGLNQQDNKFPLKFEMYIKTQSYL